jgi:hypothetical protein
LKRIHGALLKLIGTLLLLSGWFLVLAALVMLRTFAQRASFIVAGMGIEILGLVLLMQAYTSLQRRSQ